MGDDGARLNYEKDNCHVGSCSRFNGSYRATALKFHSRFVTGANAACANVDRANATGASVTGASVDGCYVAACADD